MNGVVGRNLGAALEYFIIGTVWPGTVLRGVWFVVSNSAATGNIQFAVAVSGERSASAASMNAGESLVEESELRIAPVIHPFLLVLIAVGQPVEFTLPVYKPVTSGPMHVLCAGTCGGNCWLMAGLVIEPERLVRPALERGAAARLRGAPGEVMETLRVAAEAARG